MSDPNKFGPNYKGHNWEATLTKNGDPAMACDKKGCSVIWLPHMTSKEIKWCKGA